LQQYLHISGSIPASDAVIILSSRPESVAVEGQKSSRASVRGIGSKRSITPAGPGHQPTTLQTPSSVAGETVDANSHVTTGAILPSIGARSAPSDLFDLLESKPVWSVEELAEVLTVSPKTLYKQAKRGNFPSFRIGSCVRVHGKGLADHLRSRMKK
jgi:excisionase family DNA binding protein